MNEISDLADKIKLKIGSETPSDIASTQDVHDALGITGDIPRPSGVVPNLLSAVGEVGDINTLSDYFNIPIKEFDNLDIVENVAAIYGYFKKYSTDRYDNFYDFLMDTGGKVGGRFSGNYLHRFYAYIQMIEKEHKISDSQKILKKQIKDFKENV